MEEWFLGLPEEDGVYWTLPFDKRGNPEIVEFSKRTFPSPFYKNVYGSQYFFGSEESCDVPQNGKWWWLRVREPEKPEG